jgi:hypothetical protein
LFSESTKKLLIVFHTGWRNRQIKLYFSDIQVPPFSFDIGNYNETLNQQICYLERQQTGVESHFEDSFYQNIINNFNISNNDTEKITPKTRVGDKITYFLNNPNIITS